MPTGYTSIIEESDGCTFEEYVWRCARAFGALIEMRDEALNAPVPEVFEVDSYYKRSLEQDQARLTELQAMTEEQAEIAAASEYRASLDEWEKSEKRRLAALKRYDDIVTKVKAWEPPSVGHEGLKAFMLQQIEISTEGMRERSWKEPQPRTGKAWLREQRVAAAQSVKRSAESLAQATERVNNRNRWVEDLRASVPPPQRMRP